MYLRFAVASERSQAVAIPWLTRACLVKKAFLFSSVVVVPVLGRCMLFRVRDEVVLMKT